MGLDKCVMICTHHCSIILANFIALKILCAVSLSLFPSSGNYWSIYYLCCCSVAKLFPTLCNSMDCSFPGFPVLRNLLEFAQIHVHWVSDAIQPSHSLSPPSPSALNLSQHQSLFQWVDSASVGQSIGASASASVLSMNIQGWFSLRLTSLISLQSKRLSRVFSSTTVWKHQFFGAQPSLWSNSHIYACLLEKL